MSLGAGERRLLERAIQKARALLEQDFAVLLEGRFGIHVSGRVEEPSRLHLSDAEQAARDDLVGALEYLKAQGLRPEAAAARLRREAVFTALNRLVAVRIAEAIGLLPESLARGRESQGFREFLEIFPLLAKETSGGYWTYLRLCADELSADAPVLFDPRNPLLALEPSPKTLDELSAIFADPDLAHIWREPEALGWSYQYFNTDQDRRAAREAAAPRSSWELAVRNQWFTPRYVVDFLVHNTVGRRLIEAGYENLRDLPLLVDVPPAGSGRPLDLEAVRVLDPAVGSGHFLLGCYDVLERAWSARGVPPNRAAERILPCLWGIDIDPRCAQVAAAALVLRARRHCRDQALPRPNIVTARPLPEDDGLWERVLKQADGGLRTVVAELRLALQKAPLLGPLLKAEETLRGAVERAGGLGTGGLFSEEYVHKVYSELEQRALTILDAVAREASATPAERLFAAEAVDALRFVEVVRQRYDVVLMNPPFGEPVPETKEYLRAGYPWIPWKDHNLLAVFVARGLELLQDGGYLGAITSRAGLFLTTFEAWRREVLLRHHLVALADLGYGVMEGALVEAAAYVLGQMPRRGDEPAVFLRLLRDTDRPNTLAAACREAREGTPSTRVFRVAPSELAELPGAPLAYWVPAPIRRLFRELPPLEGNGAEVRQGLATADDFRFVRAFWEVDPRKIARSRDETFQGKRWAPFAKGGEYSPYYADIHLVVNWEEDGRPVREFEQAVVRNPQYYFRPGLTWPRRTNSGFGLRTLPKGTIFADKGSAALTSESLVAMTLLGYATSRLCWALLDGLLAAGEETSSGSPSRSYEVGLVQKLPWVGPKLDSRSRTQVGRLSIQLVTIRAGFDEAEEATRRFICPAVVRHDEASVEARIRTAVAAYEDAVVRGIDLAHESEHVLHEVLHLDEESERYLDEEYGPHPASYPKHLLGPDEEREFARLYQMPIEALIDEVVETRGGSRTIATKSYFLDRRLEVLAHVFRRHPAVLAEARRRLGLLPPEEPRRSAEDLVSYLVGCALGRWDVRIGRDPSLAPPAPDPFDPVSLCPPGMLVGPDGMPAREAPPGYPLELPPDRILVDDEGHRWDIVRRMRAAAEVLFDDPDAILLELEQILGRPLREYLRRDFFKAHLGRYTKSRRRAPIYWYLRVPSREWGAWIYAPMVSREMLFAVLREARDKERALGEVRERLRRDLAGGGRDRRRLERELEATEELLREVAEFRVEANRVANLGWEPDLDDGFVLCAAPLSRLFPDWRVANRDDARIPGDPEQARRMLKEGKFPWASVARWRESL